MSSHLIFRKNWAELSLNIENGVTIMWSVKSVGMQNPPFLKFWEKTNGALQTNVDKLSRYLKIWVGIVSYDGYHW